VAEDEGVAIFSLQPGVGSVTSVEVHRAAHFLQEASHDTGGQPIRIDKLSDGVNTLLHAIHEQWVLDILPHQARDQKLHSLTIKSSEKDLQLSAPVQILLQ
jgi:hypothetical protein